MNTEIFPAYEEYLQAARIKVAYGGRGSAKTRTFVSILKNNVKYYGWRLACFRETMKSLDDSVYQEFVDEIERCGDDDFTILRSEIYHPGSGGIIKFDGLKGNTQKLKGYANFDAAWVEEAENVSKESWSVLIPTLRKDGSELWVSFNPGSPLDETYKRFVTECPYPEFKDGRRYSVIKKVNFTENPRFPRELQDDMDLLKSNDFELYRHIYLGEPIANSDLAIIKPMWIQAAIDSHLKLNIRKEGGKIGGFDVADSGRDFNAFICRHGQIVSTIEEFKDQDAVAASRYVHSEAVRLGIDMIVYDDIGVGVAAKGVFREEQSNLLNSGARGFCRTQATGFCAAAGVMNPETEYMPGKKNKDAFLNLKAQAWYNVADRFRNTWQAVNGKPYDAEKILSIPSELPMVSKLTAELAQPRREFSNGKMKVESKEDMFKRGVVSPNLADAFIMAFFEDSLGFDLAALI